MKKYIIYLILCLPLFALAQGPGGGIIIDTSCDDVDPSYTRYWKDADGDGYGNPAIWRCEASLPSGYVAANVDRVDCDDSNPNLKQVRTWYRDVDGDGHGTSNDTKSSCTQPAGYVDNGNDCNDNDVTVHKISTWYRDVDGDGYGNGSIVQNACTQPAGYVNVSGDCDDNDANANPGMVEPCTSDGLDNDCNGQVDELTPTVPTATVTKECGKTILRQGSHSLSIGVWYWQSSETGTSTANSNETLERISGTTYYLRPINEITGCWGDAITITYDVYPLPAVPTYTVVNNCGNTVIQRNNPPSGITWYWQESETGESTLDSSASVTKTTGSSLYLRARSNITGCWSDAATISYDVNDVPDAPPMPQIINDCGSTRLIKGLPPHPSVTSYWQSTDSGTSTAESSDTLIRTTGTSHYLRSRNNLTGCWGAPRTINYTIDPMPVWYLDADNDGFAGTTISQCSSPGTGYGLTALPVTDCDDSNPSVNPNMIWYADGDGDGFGNPNMTMTQCTQPSGYVSNGNDKCPGVHGTNEGCLLTPHQLTLSDENYVFTRVYQKPLNAPEEIQYNEDVIESVTYFDGLGRGKQQIAIKASPEEKDILTHIQYDAYGRQDKQYLSFQSNGVVGSHKVVDVNANINAYYLSKHPNDFMGIDASSIGDVNAYSESIFEASPLNRTLEQGAPGKSWKADGNNDDDHTIKFDWQTNDANDVFYFKVDFVNGNTEQPTLVKAGYFVQGRLYVSIVKDENWQPNQTHPKDHTTREYKDKRGRVVLKRTYDENVGHDTYYVYDDFGNLSFVIPPKVEVTDGVDTLELSELCYQYRYDKRNRLVEKKIPGKGWEYIVYNALDQSVLTQDANLRKENSGKPWDQWLFTKYDAFGRVVYTGSVVDNSSRKIVQVRAESDAYEPYEDRKTTPLTMGGTSVYYTKKSYPTSIYKVYAVNYYDDYELGGIVTLNPTTSTVAWEGMEATGNVKGLPTVSQTRVLETNHWITNTTFYDEKGRPWEVHSKNDYLNTEDWVLSKLDFAGKVEKNLSIHLKNGVYTNVLDTFTYDHMGRMLTQTQKINAQEEETIVSNAYDALGQLESKAVGGGLQNVDYIYNVRGWLVQINNPDSLGNDLFAFGINYDATTENLGATALYNGNIGETIWRTANDDAKRSYGYQYDALNRIKVGLDNTTDKRYSLNSMSYDKNGNILALQRNGHMDVDATNFGVMDDLTYAYDGGNKLAKVTDNGNDAFGFKDATNTDNDYGYDANGNLVLDKNKNISSITYNHLNLPTRIEIPDGRGDFHEIIYAYDATGVKQRKTVVNAASMASTTTLYSGNYVYKNDKLEFMSQPEGYVEPVYNSGGTTIDHFEYTYQYKDHLGNIRLSYQHEPQQLLESNFDSDVQGWYKTVSSTIANESGRLKVSMVSKWEGTHIHKFDIPALKRASVSMDVDMGTTKKISVTIWQYREDGSYISRSGDDISSSGFKKVYVDVDPEAYRLRIKIAKEYDPADDGVNTHFYVDNVVLQGEDLQIKEEKNYYPFGLQHKGYNDVITGVSHNYGFGGKELSKEINLNMYDFGARNYNPELGKWLVVDALADVKGQIDNSPYSYAMNNPIYFVDPDGNCPPGVDCTSVLAGLIASVNAFLENNDVILDVDLSLDLKIGVEIGVSLGEKGSDVGIDAGFELLNIEIFDFNGSLVDGSKPFDVDYITKYGELKISQKVNLGITFEGTKYDVVDGENSFTAYDEYQKATDRIKKLDFFEKTESSLGSTEVESVLENSNTTTFGNTEVGTGTGKSVFSISSTGSEDSSTLKLGGKGGGFLFFSGSLEIGFKKKVKKTKGK